MAGPRKTHYSVAMGELRIGTAERERAAAELGEHLAAGRLTTDEFDERVQRAYQARTAADIAPLFADLPDLNPPQSPRPRTNWWPAFAVVLVLACIAWVALLRVPPFFLFPFFWIFFVGRRFGGPRFGRRPFAPHRF
jgi:DUF1707 SHOCT-like domain